MGYIIEGNEENDVVLRRVSSLLNEDEKLENYLTILFILEEDGTVYPYDPESNKGREPDNLEVLYVSLSLLEPVWNQYGDRLTRLNKNEFLDYMGNWMHLWNYKYSMQLVTMLQKFNVLDNYDKTSSIRTDYEGSESNNTSYTGSESDAKTYSGSTTNAMTYAGSESNDTTNKVNGTNNAQTLTTRTKDENLRTFTNRTDTNVESFNNRSDTNLHSFNNRADNSTRTFNQRFDLVTERTHGNIGVTTSSKMLDEARVTADFSVYYNMFRDFLTEISVMI